MHLFAQLSKVDLARHEVWGVATAEVVDKEGEIFDYQSSKPYFQSWSDEIAKATDGRSLGNVREMHAPSAVGKLVALEFDDQLKQIRVGAKIVDDTAWQKCTLGVYTGFSIGGAYVKTWTDGDFTRFTARPVEISVVDNPCVPGAHFTAIKTDGSAEVRKFQSGVHGRDGLNGPNGLNGPAIAVTAYASPAPATTMPASTAQAKTMFPPKSVLSSPSTSSIPSTPSIASTASPQTPTANPDQNNQRSSAVRFSSSTTQLLPGANSMPEPTVSALQQDLTALRAEIAANNQELEKSLANLLSLIEKLVSPNPPSTRLARTAVPSVTVRKEDDSAAPDKPETPPSVHELLKLALQNPQRAANYLR